MLVDLIIFDELCVWKDEYFGVVVVFYVNIMVVVKVFIDICCILLNVVDVVVFIDFDCEVLFCLD